MLRSRVQLAPAVKCTHQLDRLTACRLAVLTTGVVQLTSCARWLKCSALLHPALQLWTVVSSSNEDILIIMIVYTYVCTFSFIYRGGYSAHVVDLGAWKYTLSTAAVSCADGRVYQECGSACATTCDNYMSPPLCLDACRPGCFCPEGTVLHVEDDRCVATSDCPGTGIIYGEAQSKEASCFAKTHRTINYRQGYAPALSTVV